MRGVEVLPKGKKKNRLLRQVSFFQEDYRDRLLAFDEWVALTVRPRLCRLRFANPLKPAAGVAF
jgi:hypothetical protein